MKQYIVSRLVQASEDSVFKAVDARFLFSKNIDCLLSSLTDVSPGDAVCVKYVYGSSFRAKYFFVTFSSDKFHYHPFNPVNHE